MINNVERAEKMYAAFKAYEHSSTKRTDGLRVVVIISAFTMAAITAATVAISSRYDQFCPNNLPHTPSERLDCLARSLSPENK